ncbi:MAG TPA: hypothetical protein DFS52_00405 [Myxococcales bacterium]|jgi:hypothetical protein|nr:hypothetical protein [Myxococcales bacterium]
MSQPENVRSVLPHPPKAIPNYFLASAFEGAQIAEPGKSKSRLLELYDQLAPSHFASIPEELGEADLDWLDRFQMTRLEIEREERRMHFGALALVSLLFFLLLPQIVAMEFANIALNLLALLLLTLVVPYVFVYFGYENRVRAMALGHLRLVEARTERANRPE